jgi:hypothetical protein
LPEAANAVRGENAMSSSPAKAGRRALLGGVAALAAPARVQAQADRPIRMIVAYPPGGASDLTIRALAPGVSEQLGQSLVIENRSGASGGIGLMALARAATDGQTYAIAAESAIYRTLLRSDLGYHGLHDLDPVAMLVSQPIVIAVHPVEPGVGAHRPARGLLCEGDAAGGERQDGEAADQKGLLHHVVSMAMVSGPQSLSGE